MMWDPTTEQGILCDFDLSSSPSSSLLRPRDVSEQRVPMIAGLLECKELCDDRKLRLSRDLVEPHVWLLVSAYLSPDDFSEKTSFGMDDTPWWGWMYRT